MKWVLMGVNETSNLYPIGVIDYLLEATLVFCCQVELQIALVMMSKKELNDPHD